MSACKEKMRKKKKRKNNEHGQSTLAGRDMRQTPIDSSKTKRRLLGEMPLLKGVRGLRVSGMPD